MKKNSPVASVIARTATVVALMGVAAAAGTANRADASTAVAPMRHAALLKAEPGKNDTVATSPKVIKLWFSESVQSAATSIRVTGPDAHVVTLGKVSMDTAAKSPVVFPVTEALKPGKYDVAWKAMATDGHPSNGTFLFVVREPAKGAK